MDIYCPNLDQFNFSVNVLPTQTAVGSPTSEEITVDDCLFDESTNATVDVGASINPTPIVGNLTSPSYESLDPAIATVSESGVVERVADGTARILVQTPWLTKKVNIDVERIESETVRTLLGFKEGTLAEEGAKLLDLLEDGKSTSIYSTANYSTATYVRNPSFWGATIDLTCIPASHSFNPTKVQKGGCLITPKHIVCASHYALSVGNISHFVTMDNECIARTVVARQTIFGDLCIAELDEELPESITPAKLFPADWREYVGTPYGVHTNDLGVSTYWTSPIPIFCQNQTRRGYVFELQATNDTTPNGGYKAISGKSPTESPAVDFTGNVLVSGESGGVIFALIENQPIALTAHHWPLGGPDYALYVDQINAYCDPYEVSIIDVSAYESFGE